MSKFVESGGALIFISDECPASPLELTRENTCLVSFIAPHTDYNHVLVECYEDDEDVLDDEHLRHYVFVHDPDYARLVKIIVDGCFPQHLNITEPDEEDLRAYDDSITDVEFAAMVAGFGPDELGEAPNL